MYIVNLKTISPDGNGSVSSTAEINDSTSNGPTLTDEDRFGTSVANIGDLDNDGVDDIVVGARADDNNSLTDNGAVHIMFLNTDGSVDSTVEINDSTLNGPVLSNEDYFGYAIVNIGDLNNDGVEDIAVSARDDSGGGDDRGAIHIMFMNTDGTGAIISTAQINDSTTNGPSLSDYVYFGYSMANIGDLNDDGVNDLAVGAAFADTSGNNNRGSIFIMFLNTDGSVDSTVEINDDTTNGPVLSDSDYFGYSIANIGDLNNDGTNDLVVGAFADDTGGTGRGAVYILFMNTDGTASSTVKIASGTNGGPTLSDSDGFGVGVSGVGDLNNDGIEDLAVGTFGGEGSVYILFMATSGSATSSLELSSGQYLNSSGPQVETGSSGFPVYISYIFLATC